MSRYTLVLLLVTIWCAPAGAQDHWPQFRGPGARGVSEASGLPTRWSTTENVAWAADLPGLGWSSPVVWDDTVYVTTVVSAEPVEEPLGGLYRGRETWSPSTAEHRWLVYALDVDTGAVRWEREVHRGAPAGGYHMKNTLATETPVTDGDALFVYFGNLGVFCLDTTDGRLRWSHDVEPAATRLEWGTAASPVLHDGRLYVVNDNDGQSYLLALSAETGAEVWRIARDEGTNWATPFIWENEQRTEIVTNGTDRVRFYDLDGNLLWELTGMSSITVPTPFAEFGLLYIGSGYLGDQSRPVFAVRPGASGDISLRGSTDNEFIAWSLPQAAPYQPLADPLRRRAVHAPRPRVLHRARRADRRGDLLSTARRSRGRVHRVALGLRRPDLRAERGRRHLRDHRRGDVRGRRPKPARRVHDGHAGHRPRQPVHPDAVEALPDCGGGISLRAGALSACNVGSTRGNAVSPDPRRDGHQDGGRPSARS